MHFGMESFRDRRHRESSDVLSPLAQHPVLKLSWDFALIIPVIFYDLLLETRSIPYFSSVVCSGCSSGFLGLFPYLWALLATVYSINPLRVVHGIYFMCVERGI